MKTNRFGRTDLDLSLLTFGCGAVGGLMTAGAAADQDRAVAWARDNAINHFDTAPSYGNGASEENLGRALGPNREGIVVSTKVGISEADLTDIPGAIRHSLETSMRRLRQDHIDLLQLHNTLADPEVAGSMPVDRVLDEVVGTFEALRDEGKIRYLGFTAKGETDALHALIESERFDGAQVFYNMLAPSAGEAQPDGFPAQDYRRLLDAAGGHGVGTIAVRVLAGGALSGSEARHPLGVASVAPIGSGRDYSADVASARRLAPLVEAGEAASLPELAVRWVISNLAVTTMEIGIATLDELQLAAGAVNKGPLLDGALRRVRELQADFAGR